MELNKKFQESLDLKRNAGAARFRKIENVQQILWIQNNQIPPFYVEVLQYVSCTLSGQGIDTNLLFPLLVHSRLPQEVLGQIWSVCNQTFPGQLTFQEFFAAMALVAIRQQNNSAQINLSQRPEPQVQQPQPQQQPQEQIQANFEDDDDDDEFGDFTEATGELQSQPAAPAITPSHIAPTIDSFHKEPSHQNQIPTEKSDQNQQENTTEHSVTPIPVIPVSEVDFSMASIPTAPMPSGFVENHQQEAEMNAPANNGDIYAALRDISGPSVSEELPKLELPVLEQPHPVNAEKNDNEEEDDDDFGDFEEAKNEEPTIPEPVFKNLKFQKCSLSIFENSNRFPKKSPPHLSQSTTLSSDFDLLAGLDFGTPSEPVLPIEAPTTEDRLAQVLSLDLPDLQETQNRSIDQKGEEVEDVENEELEISSPDNENMPSWDIITNDESEESKSRSNSEIPPVSVEESEQLPKPIEETAEASEVVETPEKEVKIPKRRSLLSKAEPVWKNLLKECLRVIRITHDVFKGAEADILTEVLLAKEGQDYLANVCSIYLASYRYLTALRNFGFSITPEMKEIDGMWESLADLVQNHSKTLELPLAKVRPITRDCKICLHKSKEDYHFICRCMYQEVIKEDLPDFRLTS
ncbi:Oidioi.mRNA.OKI2018_I69.chr2.g8356.t1.cds [Oikopleura dioica]|uniref:Oidioi.mRNA.OKI2018_I69.chr2.g8356.t1.cds n=1 Tax=Oikopleura dioica TaxID=34765 RepID=A0ABN7T9X7_OIKDI|nr:Oidioi.mRNA.OKI2018_I69.chr2.g8356.t1.cds [Oikopleura dioica]